jgi:hypothetical protein
MSLLVLALAGLGEGCVAVAVGTAVVATGASAAVYRRGWYRSAISAPHYQVDRAVRQTARRARLIERERTCDGHSSYYRFQDLHDVKVKIKLKAATPDSTKVYIRVGFWGDRASSMELLQGIEDDIKAGPAGRD